MTDNNEVCEIIKHPITSLRYQYAQEELRAYALAVAFDLGYSMMRTLSYGDLLELHLAADNAGISTSDLNRFRRMDLALAVADGNGESLYLAVEIAFRAEQSGIERALTNARLLARFTGRPAKAVIAVGRDYTDMPQATLDCPYPVLPDTAGGEPVYLHQLVERNQERAQADLRYERKLYGY